MQLTNDASRYGAISQWLHWTTAALVIVLARSTHIALYALLFALPVSGWLAASSEGAPVSFFGITTVPQWGAARTGPISHAITRQSGLTAAAARAEQASAAPKNEGEGALKEIHEVLGNVLLVLASFHVLAALKHHFVDHDDVVRHMLPRAGPQAHA